MAAKPAAIFLEIKCIDSGCSIVPTFCHLAVDSLVYQFIEKIAVMPCESVANLCDFVRSFVGADRLSHIFSTVVD